MAFSLSVLGDLGTHGVDNLLMFPVTSLDSNDVFGNMSTPSPCLPEREQPLKEPSIFRTPPGVSLQLSENEKTPSYGM